MRILSIRNVSIPASQQSRKMCEVSTSDASTQRVHLTKHFSCNPYAFFLSTFVCLLPIKLWTVEVPFKRVWLIHWAKSLHIHSCLVGIYMSNFTSPFHPNWHSFLHFNSGEVDNWISLSYPSAYSSRKFKGLFHWIMLKTSCH